MDVEYIDRKKIRLLTWTSFIGHFVHVGGEGSMGKGVNGRIVTLANYKFHFLRVHDILV